MPISTIESERVPLRDTRRARGDRLVYQKFSEKDAPDLAKAAQRIHASGYEGEGFVSHEAITEDGSLSPTIDKARGGMVDYYLGRKQDDEQSAISTIRKIHIPFGGTLEDLPAYQLSRSALYPEQLEYLEGLSHPDRVVKEISAFAHTPDSSPGVGFEMLRNVIHDGLGSHEVWFFSIVSSTYDTLAEHFGPVALRRVGDSILIDDPEVNGVELVPTIFEPDTFLKDMYETVMTETDPKRQKAYLSNFRYMLKGLTDEELGEEMATIRRNMPGFGSQSDETNIQTPPLKGDLRSRMKNINRDPLEWQEPAEFDLGSWADRREVGRLIDEGEITSVIDRQKEIADELFELRYPDLKTDAAARIEYVEGIVGQNVRFGRFHFFPWEKSLVHYADREDHQALRTFRNRNIISDDEQAKLLDPQSARLAIFGLSVGSSAAWQSVQAGIGGAVALGDHDVLSPTNVNRIAAGMPQVGEAKIDITAKRISQLDPYVKQTLFRQGIGVENIDQLAEFGPTIIVDEVDNFAAKALLRQFAARYRIALIMATDVGERSLIDIERYDSEIIEPFDGRLTPAEFEDLSDSELPPSERLRLMTKIVGMENASPRLVESLTNPRLGGLPQLGTTAAVGGAAVAVAARSILLGNELPSGRYKVDVSDLLQTPES